MEYDMYWIINTLSIVLIGILSIVLIVTIRFTSETCYAAMIILFTSVADYLYLLFNGMGWDTCAVIVAPLAFSANLTIIPMLWILVHKGFDSKFKFKFGMFVHFLPAICYAALVAVMFCFMYYDYSKYAIYREGVNFNSLLTGVNFVILSVQLVSYFLVMFKDMRKIKYMIVNHCSDAKLLKKRWIPRFVSLMGGIIVMSMITYSIWPTTTYWLFYILNTVAIIFLLYQELENAHTNRNRQLDLTDIKDRLEDNTADACFSNKNDKANCELLNQYADSFVNYLTESEAYTNPSLTLKDVAVATGISANNLSKAINLVLGKTFFDLVNGYRVEKSKKLLVVKKEKGYTIDTIAEECGFNSRVTLSNAFKKQTNMTTSQWLKSVRE